MTTISPTSVSMYDFLYQDTQPIVSLLADAAALSIPQARRATTTSLQAIVSALLAYHQRHSSQAVSKKLFGRSAIKDLRQHNAMSFETIKSALYHRHDVTDTLFLDSATIEQACSRIADEIDASPIKVNTLLTSLCVIAIRELAILSEYSQLDSEELDKWFALQPQFLAAARFDHTLEHKNNVPADLAVSNTEVVQAEIVRTEIVKTNNISPFDSYWYQLTGFDSTQVHPVQDMQQATPNYLKAIGRSAQNVQRDQHDDLLMFEPMSAIALPHQRWLLQLAKIADIYLSRNRLQIASEPASAPTPPLVNLALLGGLDSAQATSADSTASFKSYPLWKNPVIWITLAVIAFLSVLAMIKYQAKQADPRTSVTQKVVQKDKRESAQQQEVIEKISDNAEH
ncbi:MULTISPECIES: hypothetical protein [unclassified Psychrobacter]|uniref:hypothetical protein n=1 Tax=unclassified Psychrobacter TaxID=196806 RepID=UPI003FD49118